jgi:hypothetical protein
MVILNLYYCWSYFIYLLQVYISYFFLQIKIFKWCVLNVWIIMHIETLFLGLSDLNITIMTKLSFSKILSFFSCSLEMLRTYFSIWTTNAFNVCNMVKHALNILWVNHINDLNMNFKNEIKNEKSWVYFMFILCKMG